MWLQRNFAVLFSYKLADAEEDTQCFARRGKLRHQKRKCKYSLTCNLLMLDKPMISWNYCKLNIPLTYVTR